jgi:hypothetical protein
VSPLELAAPPRATYVKRRRASGWKKPDGAISCTRNGKSAGTWGNPFKVGDKLPDGGEVLDHDHSVQLYREWLRERPGLMIRAVNELTGATLMCWCAELQVCHVQDVLIPLVNEGRMP